MPISCWFGHRASAERIFWNNGRYISACERCGCDLVRRKGQWFAIEKGRRVVWRHRTPTDFGYQVDPESAEARRLLGRGEEEEPLAQEIEASPEPGE